MRCFFWEREGSLWSPIFSSPSGSYCFVFRFVLFLFSSSCFFVVQFGIFQSSGTNGKKSGNFYIFLIWTRRCQNFYLVGYFISNKCLDHTIQEMGTTSRVDEVSQFFVCSLLITYSTYVFQVGLAGSVSYFLYLGTLNTSLHRTAMMHCRRVSVRGNWSLYIKC